MWESIASFPSPIKGRVGLFPSPTPVSGVSPERSLTYSPGSQDSSKRKPLPPGGPFSGLRDMQSAEPPPKKAAAVSVGEIIQDFSSRSAPLPARQLGALGGWERTTSLPSQKPLDALVREGCRSSRSGPELSASEFSRRRPAGYLAAPRSLPPPPAPRGGRRAFDSRRR